MTTKSSKEASTQPPKEVTIFCDGSSLGNGRAETRAAAVALLGFRGYWKSVGVYLGNATNQQAEIAAAAVGLEALREPCRYVVETMSGRFRRKANHDWWQRLDQAVGKHQVEWEWTRGHDGHLVQEAVDRAARRLAMLGRVDQEVLRDAEEKVGTIELPVTDASSLLT
jgi:ribonuclease HI